MHNEFIKTVDSRCGLHCTGCEWKESRGCGGCIETNGNPFYGECGIAQCCQGKGYMHCGECAEVPCKDLYEYSYLDPEHGDNPPGFRVTQCRCWAAECGVQRWVNVLLTDCGFYRNNELDKPIETLIDRLADMLGKPFAEARVLFIPTASMQVPAKAEEITERLCGELLQMGFRGENITVYDIDGKLSERDAMAYDAVYLTGGNTPYLRKRVWEAGFNKILLKMVYSNKVYIGMSAGSMLAMPNFNIDKLDETKPLEFVGLSLINAYFTVHCEPGTPARTDLRLPHIALQGGQAIAVNWKGYEVLS